jgi:hypothetical protein
VREAAEISLGGAGLGWDGCCDAGSSTEVALSRSKGTGVAGVGTGCWDWGASGLVGMGYLMFVSSGQVD